MTETAEHIEQPTRLLKAAQAIEQQNGQATPPPVPVAASAPQVSRPPEVERPPGAATAPPPGSVDLLLARADKSSKARTRAAAAKVLNLLADLTDRVETEAAERREKARLAEERRQAEAAAREERERARAEVEALKKKLAKAQAKLRSTPATKTATEDGPSSKEVRSWARTAGVDCPAVGRVPQHVRDAYTAAHQDGCSMTQSAENGLHDSWLTGHIPAPPRAIGSATGLVYCKGCGFLLFSDAKGRTALADRPCVPAGIALRTGTITPGGNPVCPKCGLWYGPGLPHKCVIPPGEGAPSERGGAGMNRAGMSATGRPVVRITYNAPTGHHEAVCGTGDCTWVYTNPVKAACEEQARWHRASHRRAGW